MKAPRWLSALGRKLVGRKERETVSRLAAAIEKSRRVSELADRHVRESCPTFETVPPDVEAAEPHPQESER